jgi:OmpA-OmpF porin, OOP family
MECNIRVLRAGTAAALFAAASALVSPVHAQTAAASQAPWYGGVDISRSHLGLSGSDIDRAFARQGITSTTSLDRSNTGWGAYLGYRFGPYFALEGGYTDLGKSSYTSAATAPAIDSLQGNFRAHAWWLAPVGIYQLSDRWALLGKAGLTDVSSDLRASSITGATAPTSTSHSNAGWLLGVGTSYDITRNIYAKVEWDRYGHVGDPNTTGRSESDQLSAGVGVRF